MNGVLDLSESGSILDNISLGVKVEVAEALIAAGPTDRTPILPRGIETL